MARQLKRHGYQEAPLIDFNHLIIGLTYVASAVLAASAALQAVRHHMDPFGATVLAFATALGGGTLRDLLLGKTPVFWIFDTGLVIAVVIVALMTYFASKRMSAGSGKRLRLLMQFDAIGLALFTLFGVRVAMDAGTHWIIAIILGCVTGTVGGMIRDLLCNVTPSVLKEDLYATISLLGGLIYLSLITILGQEIAIGISFLVMLVARLFVIHALHREDA